MGNKENKMFCFQCQETAGCSGCTVSGVCGKKPDVAAMQDLLVYVTKGLSAVTTELRFDGKEIEAYVNEMIIVNLFTTITNANFDKDSIIERIKNTLATKEELMTLSGVGESRADSIIAYREENGRFQNTEELMQISGIKEGLYNKIKDNITV